MLILVRHGQTSANAGGRLQGRMDPPLDEVGRTQADALGARMGVAHRGALVISSPLVRARETAASIATALGVEVVIDERFVELDYGDFDGLPMGDVPPGTWEKWRSDPHFRPPGGESLVELDARVRPALEEQVDAARERDVIVVSHVSPIKSAVTWALGVGPEVTWRCSLDRASVTSLAIGPRGPALALFNDTSHLR